MLAAFLDTQNVTQFLVKALAVGGGFLAGYLLAWVLARLVDRWTTGGHAPEQLHRAARIIGGLVLGILVALMVYGSGGEGFGFGGGPGEGNGKSESGNGSGGKEPPPKIEQPIDHQHTNPKHPLPPEQRVRVTLLGGEDVRDEKFYLLDDDRTPVDLAGVTSALKAKKDAAAKPVGLEVRFAPNNTLPRTHPAVLRLTAWAQTNGYPVTFPAAKQ